MLSLLPPKFKALTGILFISAVALVLLGCKAAQVDPTVGAAIDAGDPAAAELGKSLQDLAGKAAGPVGYMAAGYFLPIIYAFVKSTLKGTTAAASTAVKSAAASVGLKDGGTP